MEKVYERVLEWLALYGLNVLGAIIIIMVGWIAARIIREIVRRILASTKVSEIIVSFVGSLVYVGVWVFVIIAALSKLGIQTASFIAVVGAAGLAVGLALQGALANFAAGVLIAIFHPFKAGDYIEGGGIAGFVEHIEIFTTTLRTMDNKRVIVPNGKITEDNIINYTANPTRRVDLVIGVSYGDDLDKVRAVINDVLAKDDRVLAEPAPMVEVSELGDSSVNFVVRPWVNTADYWGVYFGLTKAIKQRFDAEDITIPFPQRDIHLYPAKEE